MIRIKEVRMGNGLENNDLHILSGSGCGNGCSGNEGDGCGNTCGGNGGNGCGNTCQGDGGGTSGNSCRPSLPIVEVIVGIKCI